MAINFLSALLGNGGAQMPPGLDLNRLDPVARLRIGGSALPPPQADIPLPAPLAGPPANVMQAAALPVDVPQPAPVPAAPEPAAPPRQRRSLLDTVGRLADVFATVGGAQALYQPTLDQRQDRVMAIEDRARDIDMDALRRQAAEQQLQMGGQQIEAGSEELEDTGRARLARALGAVASNPEAAAMWPQIAQEAGIDPQRAEAIGQMLQRNPNAAGIFARSLGWTPPVPVSRSREVQIYELLNAQDPELGQAYLQNVANPDAMTPYQREQVRLAEARIGVSREALEVRENLGTAANEIRRTAAEMRGTGGTRGSTGGTILTPTQRGAVAQTREAIPGVRAQLRRVREISENLGAASGYVGGRVPGQLAGGAAAQFDRAQSLLAAQIRQLIRTVGEGSMSDYESRLNVATLPARTDSAEGRAEAIRNLENLLTEIERRSGRLLTPVAAPAAPTARAARPAARGGAARPPANPRVPPVGTVRQGYRFKGGNPASPASWERVR